MMFVPYARYWEEVGVMAPDKHALFLYMDGSELSFLPYYQMRIQDSLYPIEILQVRAMTDRTYEVLVAYPLEGLDRDYVTVILEMPKKTFFEELLQKL